MDRFTWAAVVGVVALCLAAVIAVVLPRHAEQPPDLTTPEGVVTAYISAIRDKRVDDAWALLDSPSAVQSLRPAATETPSAAEDAFRLQVNNNPRYGDRRVRIAEVKPSGDTVRVDVEITSVSQDDFLFSSGSHSTIVTFNVERRGQSWRITSSPPLYSLG